MLSRKGDAAEPAEWHALPSEAAAAEVANEAGLAAAPALAAAATAVLPPACCLDPFDARSAHDTLRSRDSSLRWMYTGMR
mmetsp:Transcript_5100/g.15513  ORF Transcript_5100/g.15513 Transcript_5100/m.15513 type:complete len:80 (+) Transcript_5100:599-838(+)